MGRLVILSGPSCVGKSPLLRALRRLYPDLTAGLRPVVLYNDRAPRPGEQDGVDYYFRRREEIEALRDHEGFTVMEVRGDLQAFDLNEIRETLAEADAFYEGNPFVGTALLDSTLADEFETLSAFVSPLSREEIAYLAAPECNVSLPDMVTDVMRRKLLRRTVKQKGVPSQKDLENVERRAGSGFREIKMAHRFGCVIPNHDGEDSENWDAFYYPLGDARRAVLAVADLLEGRKPRASEQWEESLLTGFE